MIKTYRTPWADDFPNTIIDRSLSDATKHPLYIAAKSGNSQAAYQLVKELISHEAIEKLYKIKGDNHVILVPVHAEESTGRNKIPLAASVLLSKKLNLQFSTHIIQATKVSRTNKDGWHRLAHPPAFSGTLPAGSLALLIDDTQTQGGTFAALKGHIEAHGSRVIGAYALTGKQYSVQLRLSWEMLEALKSEYSDIEAWWKQEFGYGFANLTEWEARYILKSGKSPDAVRAAILARRS